MAYYFSGWGYRENILPYFLSGIELHFDVIVWSLGLVRFHTFLVERNALCFNSVLFIAPAYGLEGEYVDKFMQEFYANPKKELMRFYRRAHWDPNRTGEDKSIDKFLLFDADYTAMYKELEMLLTREIDTGFVSSRIRHSICILPRKDLIVPLEYQRKFSDRIDAFCLEIDAPHFCLDRIPEALRTLGFYI